MEFKTGDRVKLKTIEALLAEFGIGEDGWANVPSPIDPREAYNVLLDDHTVLLVHEIANTSSWLASYDPQHSSFLCHVSAEMIDHVVERAA